jgi:hypothetical protein
VAATLIGCSRAVITRKAASALCTRNRIRGFERAERLAASPAATRRRRRTGA